MIDLIKYLSLLFTASSTAVFSIAMLAPELAHLGVPSFISMAIGAAIHTFIGKL